MQRRKFLKIGAGSIISGFSLNQIDLFAQNSKARPSKLPNVLLIMADDFGYECLSCNGNLDYQTPHLDELAQTGIRFTQCHAQPLCTPSRVKIMTGLHNFRNYEAFGYLNPNQRTFGQVMKAADYATCIVGKWQLNGIHKHRGPKPGWEDNRRPHHFGFDEYCLWQLTHEKKNGERYANPLIEQNGRILTGVEESYGPDIFTNYAIDFIKRNSKHPFLIYYPMALTHDPFVPTPDSPEWANKKWRYQPDNKFFKDMVVYADKLIGRLVQTLKETGVYENTIIIFTGDNGTNVKISTNTPNGTIQGGKGSMLDAGTHVPLIIHWPEKIKKGQVYEELVDFTDFFPTLSDIVGTKEVSDGHSLYPLLVGNKFTPRETILMHYDPQWGNNDKFRNRFARTKAYKLYQDGKFYHLATDPLEKNDISVESCTREQMKIRQKLQTILNQAPPWRED
ncbi:sulfatase-like hydrolase/transferase [candidate division KSB1 bacterium]|nr:sulfatase-like hydrolase/transferase [candidate division KSB1 bacterium]